MCTIFFSHGICPEYPLVLISNRDEFYNRPTKPLGFWEDNEDILAGRDLKDGGTWLGVNGSGYMGALTNYMDPSLKKVGVRSRGHLLGDYLSGDKPPDQYLKKLKENSRDYNGFNLILGDSKYLYYYSNIQNRIICLSPGIYGLSNRLLDTPWAKVDRGKKKMKQILDGNHANFREDLFNMMMVKSCDPLDKIPDIGIGYDWEMKLSSPFVIIGEGQAGYGTRCTTLLMVDNMGMTTVEERTYEVCLGKVTCGLVRSFVV